jgi:hypothetical protein
MNLENRVSRINTLLIIVHYIYIEARQHSDYDESAKALMKNMTSSVTKALT